MRLPLAYCTFGLMPVEMTVTLPEKTFCYLFLINYTVYFNPFISACQSFSKIH